MPLRRKSLLGVEKIRRLYKKEQKNNPKQGRRDKPIALFKTWEEV